MMSYLENGLRLRSTSSKPVKYNAYKGQFLPKAIIVDTVHNNYLLRKLHKRLFSGVFYG